MPALAKSSVGSSAGMSEDDGTRRCPRSSKNLRNRSRTSVDFMRTADHGRNVVGRKTTEAESLAHFPAALGQRTLAVPGPEPFEGPGERPALPLRQLRGDRRGNRLPAEPARLKIPLHSRPPVPSRLHAHDRASGRELVEPAFGLKAIRRFRRGLSGEAPLLEPATQFRPAAGPHRKQTDSPLIGALYGIGLGCPGRAPAGRLPTASRRRPEPAAGC
jgi:hypothetical protein